MHSGNARSAERRERGAREHRRRRMISERERERGDGITVSLWCVFVWERASPRVVAFAGRVGEWAALCAVAMDKATFQDWLGADVVLESGYRYALPDRVKAILLAAFVAKDVDEDDVIKDGTLLDEATFTDFSAALGPARPLVGSPHVRRGHLIKARKIYVRVTTLSNFYAKGTIMLHFQMRF